MLNSRGKHLPFLTEYLATLVVSDRMRPKRLGWIGGAVGVLGGVAGAVIGIVGGSGLIHLSNAGAIFAAICINLVCWATILAFWLRDRAKEQAPDFNQMLHRNCVQLAKAMLNSKRLHRELDGAAAELLENSARYWRGIVGVLAGPFWSSPNLPEHWKSVREQIAKAADQAMKEELAILASSFHPGTAGQGLGTMVEDVIETYVTGPRMRKGEPFPVGYDQARQIAEKLKLMAKEVEAATAQVSAEPAVASEYHSSQALDMALGDLKVIQEADKELRQGVNG